MSLPEKMTQLLVGASAEDLITILREMCIDREVRIEGEWGNGLTDRDALGVEIDQELAQRLMAGT